jgi:phage baseplate assembly protein gpV
MDDFLNLFKARACQIDQGWAQPRLAVVSSVDAATYTARVTIQPEGVLSGWLPIASPWIGAGWGLACPPNLGDQVLILCQEGESEHGIIVGRIWSNTVAPPGAPVGELWLIHQSGSYIKLHNDGSIESKAPQWTHNGDLHVTGNVFDSYNSLADLRTHYNEHAHPPSTTPPTPTD